jgi:hypothetical protein
MLVLLMNGRMKYAVEITSGSVIYIPDFTKMFQAFEEY